MIDWDLLSTEQFWLGFVLFNSFILGIALYYTFKIFMIYHQKSKILNNSSFQTVILEHDLLLNRLEQEFRLTQRRSKQ